MKKVVESDQRDTAIQTIKDILLEYFEDNPWTGEPSELYDDMVTAYDVVDRVVQALEPVVGSNVKQFDENTKITLTIGQLKRLVKESTDPNDTDEFFIVPLGLNSSEHLARLVNDNIERGDPCPMNIMDTLLGQLSDGMWENSRAMEKFWRPLSFENENGEVVAKIKRRSTDWNGYNIENPYIDPFAPNSLKGDPKKIREWFANHLKILVKDELKGSSGSWKRDDETPLSYFDTGTTVAMVYAVYDILKDRPERNKNIYYDAFHA